MTSNRTDLPPAVFVVDDEAAIHRSLQAWLRALDVRVHAFYSAEAFLESYCDEWSGCLLVDLRMPGMSGIELLKELRQRKCSLAAIVMTGHADEESLRQVIDAGAVGVLEKPFRAEQLKELMKRECPALFRGDAAAGDN